MGGNYLGRRNYSQSSFGLHKGRIYESALSNVSQLVDARGRSKLPKCRFSFGIAEIAKERIEMFLPPQLSGR